MIVDTRDHGSLEVNESEVGLDMLVCALSEWFNYNDNDTFNVLERSNGTYDISDPDEDSNVIIDPVDFFKEHLNLIFFDNMPDPPVGAAYSWYKWATDREGALPDDYDSFTCDFVLQILLYGEIIYG